MKGTKVIVALENIKKLHGKDQRSSVSGEEHIQTILYKQ